MNTEKTELQEIGGSMKVMGVLTFLWCPDFLDIRFTTVKLLFRLRA